LSRGASKYRAAPNASAFVATSFSASGRGILRQRSAEGATGEGRWLPRSQDVGLFVQESRRAWLRGVGIGLDRTEGCGRAGPSTRWLTRPSAAMMPRWKSGMLSRMPAGIEERHHRRPGLDSGTFRRVTEIGRQKADRSAFAWRHVARANLRIGVGGPRRFQRAHRLVGAPAPPRRSARPSSTAGAWWLGGERPHRCPLRQGPDATIANPTAQPLRHH